MTRKFANRPSERGYRWRMFDASLATFDRKRPPFVCLRYTLLAKQTRARWAGYRRGPNKVNRHFHPLAAEVLDARRVGLDPRILAGRGL